MVIFRNWWNAGSNCLSGIHEDKAKACLPTSLLDPGVGQQEM